MDQLPPVFKDRVIGVHGQKGSEWLIKLPEIRDQLIQSWSLADLQPLSNLSYNYLAFANNKNGLPVVLKIGVPNPELASEIKALQVYDGKAAVGLIDADPSRGALLLERLIPGDDLRSVRDDQKATRIAASLMQQIWIDHSGQDFPTAADWCRGFERYQKAYPAGGPLPSRLIARAAGLAAELLENNGDRILLHGDLHHMNILQGGSGWTAIDPKGILGEPAFEAGAFLLNPFPEMLQWDHITLIQQQRIEIMGDILDLDQKLITSWSFARAVLSAIWSVEDHQGWNYAIQIAESVEELL